MGGIDGWLTGRRSFAAAQDDKEVNIAFSVILSRSEGSLLSLPKC
jgi:hypothetical protein